MIYKQAFVVLRKKKVRKSGVSEILNRQRKLTVKLNLSPSLLIEEY